MYVLSVILFITICSQFFANQGPITKIDNGLVQGKYIQITPERKIAAYLGIPFAKPPVGNLRFKPPEPAEPWDDVRDATNFNAKCVQINVFRPNFITEGDEDCLYLYVYTPKLNDESEVKNLPVMFWIHGGGFLAGQGGDVMHKPHNLLKHNVVLVSTNYRLGPLGFFATDDGLIEGNMGMKDQVQALKWVQENIAHFGGDPNRVTIFGESAGAAAVHLHLMSPLSKGLFHAAIIQSGAALCSWAVHPFQETIANSKQLAEFVNCPSSNNNDMVDCLMKANASDILYAVTKYFKWDIEPLSKQLGVTVELNNEHAFLPEHPIKVLKSGKAAKVPIIIGMTKDEGVFRVATFEPKNLWDHIDKNTDQVLSLMLPNDNITEWKQFYLKSEPISQNQNEMIKLISDAYFTLGIDKSIAMHKKYVQTPIYFYFFGYRGSNSFTKIFGGTDKDMGVSHADDLLYLFPNPIPEIFDKPVTAADEKMSDIFTELWTSFAKNNIPTSEKVSVEWKPVSSDKHEYLLINHPDDIAMDSNVFPERMQFLRDQSKSTTTREEL